jgi:hypothetical protein
LMPRSGLPRAAQDITLCEASRSDRFSRRARWEAGRPADRQ